MKTRLVLALACGASLLAGAAFAQALTPTAPHVDPAAIPLYAGVAPGSEGAKQVEAWATSPGDLVARNVTRPTLTPYLPAKGKATGAAVIVMPGGGNMVLSMGREGYDVAKYLQAHGIAAFVLKYRVNETPADIGKMAPMAAPPPSGSAQPPAAGGAPGPRLNTDMAVADAQTALRMVRARATEWGVDPKRVGMVGFSAGAGNLLGVTLKNDPTAKPDFIAPIYGPFGHVDVPPGAPPMFIARAADDPLFGTSGFAIVEDWQKAGVPVELHMYETGGHGFGAAQKGTTSDGFLDQFYRWIQGRGLLKPAA